MTSYAKKERARYWPVPKKLMAQYRDGSHTNKDSNGYFGWYKNDQYHRNGDKPARINSDGGLSWYQNGEKHRDGDKPAYISADGHLVWVQNGKTHRLRGPAVIYSTGTFEWYINGKEITDEVKEWLAEEEWHGTPEQVFEFQLRFL